MKKDVIIIKSLIINEGNNMAYPKPLSEKSLQKMYLQSGINEVKSHFLHQLFKAAANLYGSVL